LSAHGLRRDLRTLRLACGLRLGLKAPEWPACPLVGPRYGRANRHTPNERPLRLAERAQSSTGLVDCHRSLKTSQNRPWTSWKGGRKSLKTKDLGTHEMERT